MCMNCEWNAMYAFNQIVQAASFHSFFLYFWWNGAKEKDKWFGELEKIFNSIFDNE